MSIQKYRLKTFPVNAVYNTAYALHTESYTDKLRTPDKKK